MPGRNLDCNKNFQIPFGVYVQVAKEKILPTRMPREHLMKYVCNPFMKKPEKQKCMHIQADQVIIVNNSKDFPITELVIKDV